VGVRRRGSASANPARGCSPRDSAGGTPFALGVRDMPLGVPGAGTRRGSTQQFHAWSYERIQAARSERSVSITDASPAALRRRTDPERPRRTRRPGEGPPRMRWRPPPDLHTFCVTPHGPLAGNPGGVFRNGHADMGIVATTANVSRSTRGARLLGRRANASLTERRARWPLSYILPEGGPRSEPRSENPTTCIRAWKPAREETPPTGRGGRRVQIGQSGVSLAPPRPRAMPCGAVRLGAF
jgi:hypothetical protein